MRGKVQRRTAFRRLVAVGAVAAVCLLAAAAGLGAVVSGRVTMLDKGDRPAEDIGQAVIWLEGGSPPSAAPATVEITTSDKEFAPHIIVVQAGSTVGFPNHDPFNHNVFSLSEENPFDLGLYGRGETRSVRFARPGVVRVYCNVHAQMSAVVVVRDNPWYTQPSSDGSFVLPTVPAGAYRLHLWHERAEEVTRDLTVPAEGLGDLALELDARGYQFKPHLNKHGQPYPQQGRRY
ncbi:MAG TPA: plastocyanin/azurin family copper-binding protein [Gemmatimonadales bacterium]|nr:plastocyanin/azurin family copper-binding protein [Gemmatimonadales bacterium]